MENHIIYDKDGKGFTRAWISNDFEYLNPIEYYSQGEIQKSIVLERDLLSIKDPILASSIDDSFYYNRAIKNWKERYEKIIKTEIPEAFIKLLTCQTKNEQIKLLKEQSLTPNQLIAFIFKSYNDFGYLFSQYSAEHHHNSADPNTLPKIIHIEDDGKIKAVGNTILSEGQLKQVIEHRKVTVSKFFDKGNEWHCLFVTFKSLRGKETWKNGQPHFHYLSDKWGVPREKVLERLKSKDIISSKVHIDILDYK